MKSQITFNNTVINYDKYGNYVSQQTSKEAASMFWTYGYKTLEIDFEKLYLMVNSDYRCYSAGHFIDGYRKADNWTGQDLFILDIDNDGNEDELTLKEAYSVFKQYKCLITTTSSHQKGKTIGNREVAPSDRYRVIIKMKNKTTCNKDEYSLAMRLLLDNMFPFADKKCSDPARFYFGSSKAEYRYFEGELLDFDNAVRMAKVSRAATKKIVPIENKEYEGENIIDAFNNNNDINAMLERYGYKKRGDRYISPNSSTGDAGVVIYEGERGDQMAYSHHSSDGWDRPMDCFGLYALKEHNGNLSSAARSLKVFR